MGCCGVTVMREEDINSIKIKKAKRRVSIIQNIDITKNYEFISILGNGTLGKVRLYRDKNKKNLLFAIKSLKKTFLSISEIDFIKKETDKLININHPNIIKYLGLYEDDYYIHILMEYFKGYDLSKIIALKKYNNYEEKDICEIICQLLQALKYIHKHNIIHRDIKPENIIFSDRKNYSSLKLIDFGFTNIYHKKRKNLAGSPYYMSPEILEGNSYPQSDVWSLGIIIYHMLTGKYPFKGKTCEILYDNIKNQDFNLLNTLKLNCSDEAKDFLVKCLNKDYNERLTAEECLEHPWITKFCLKKNFNTISNTETNDNSSDYDKKDDLKKEIYLLLNKINPEIDINELREYFISLDADNTGKLSINDIQKTFEELNIDYNQEKLKTICQDLDSTNDGQINYYNLLDIISSSNNFEDEDKLLDVFNLLKQENSNKQTITFDSMLKSLKNLNININENDIKKFLEDNEEMNFETFKRIIKDDKTII